MFGMMANLAELWCTIVFC